MTDHITKDPAYYRQILEAMSSSEPDHTVQSINKKIDELTQERKTLMQRADMYQKKVIDHGDDPAQALKNTKLMIQYLNKVNKISTQILRLYQDRHAAGRSQT